MHKYVSIYPNVYIYPCIEYHIYEYDVEIYIEICTYRYTQRQAHTHMLGYFSLPDPLLAGTSGALGIPPAASCGGGTPPQLSGSIGDPGSFLPPAQRGQSSLIEQCILGYLI